MLIIKGLIGNVGFSKDFLPLSLRGGTTRQSHTTQSKLKVNCKLQTHNCKLIWAFPSFPACLPAGSGQALHSYCAGIKRVAGIRCDP